MTNPSCHLSRKLRELSLPLAGCGFDALMLHSVRPSIAAEMYQCANRLQEFANDLDALQIDAAWPDALEAA